MINIEDLKTISIPVHYDVDTDFDNDRFIKMRLRLQHDGINPNCSEFDLEDIKRASPSLANTPILANVIWEDGIPQFGAHDIIIEKNKLNEEEYKEIYIESPIGIIPANDIGYEINEYDDKNHVYINAYIYRKISNYAEDIILRDKNIKLSMEIEVEKFAYDNKRKIYKIIDFKYSGITFLNNNLGTGMEHAEATIELNANFSLEKNKEQLLFMMNELKDVLQLNNNKNINNSNNTKTDNVVFDDKNAIEGGLTKLDKDTEKLQILATYNLTVEQLDFSIDDLSIEEFKTKIDIFAEKNKSDSVDTDTKDVTDLSKIEKNTIVEDFNDKEVPEVKVEDEAKVENKAFVHSKFATVNQKREALNNVLDPIIVYNGDGDVSESTYYYVTDFDDNYVLVETYFYSADDSESGYGRFPYTFDETTLTATITGQFEKMISTWLTEGEYQKLQDEQLGLRAKLEAILAEYNTYKSEYSIKDVDVSEFQELKEYRVSKELEEFNNSKSLLFSNFEEFLSKDSEFNKLKENSGDLTIELLEKELFYLKGKQGIKFESTKKKEAEKPLNKYGFVPVMKIDTEVPPVTITSPYGTLLG